MSRVGVKDKIRWLGFTRYTTRDANKSVHCSTIYTQITIPRWARWAVGRAWAPHTPRHTNAQCTAMMIRPSISLGARPGRRC